MKKNVMKLVTILFTTIFILNSCSSDDSSTPSETTVAEDKVNIEESIDQLLDCFQNFENGSFSESVKNFFDISNGDISSEYAEFLLDELDVFNFDIENFNFNAHKGAYTWNQSGQFWEFDSNVNDMVFFFPSEENSTNNNIELGITSYSSQTVIFNDENFLYPTNIAGYLKENGDEIFTINLSNVTYEVNNNFSFPSNLDLVIFTAPFTHTFDLSKITSTQFDFSYDFQDNGSCVTSISSLINLNTSDYENITGAEDFDNAVGTILHQDFEIRYTVEIDNIDAIEDPTVIQINQLVNAEVFINDAKVGDLEYAENTDGETVVNIIYKDGTSDNVDIYVGDDFVDELEAIFSAFIPE